MSRRAVHQILFHLRVLCVLCGQCRFAGLNLKGHASARGSRSGNGERAARREEKRSCSSASGACGPGRGEAGRPCPPTARSRPAPMTGRRFFGLATTSHEAGRAAEQVEASPRASGGDRGLLAGHGDAGASLLQAGTPASWKFVREYRINCRPDARDRNGAPVRRRVPRSGGNRWC